VSQRATSEPRAEVETAVRNRSQYADTLHRLDPDADEPEPACVEAEYRSDAEFTDVPVAAYPHYSLCGNPECFGSEWW
jgi:hypothetical protein